MELWGDTWNIPFDETRRLEHGKSMNTLPKNTFEPHGVLPVRFGGSYSECCRKSFINSTCRLNLERDYSQHFAAPINLFCMFSFRVGYLPAFAMLVFVFLKWSQSCGDRVWSSDHCDVKIYQDCFPLQSVDLESHTCCSYHDILHMYMI